MCTFDGTARTVRVRGVGTAVLAEPNAFSRPQAAWVDLIGATIGSEGPSVRVAAPLRLEPLQVNDSGSPYDVTYEAGPEIRVTVAQGGGEGSFKGQLAGAACDAFCPVSWSADAKKGIVLHLATDARSIDLTGPFPYLAKPVPGAPQLAWVDGVELVGARGRLVCPDGERPYVDAKLAWPKSQFGDLKVEPIAVRDGLLRVTITTDPESRPQDEVLHHVFPWGVAGLSGAGLVLAVIAAFVAMKRLRVPHRGAGAMRILFLAANPTTTEHLDLEEEIRSIDRELLAAKFRDRISFIPKSAVRPDDLVRHVRMERPTVVHFSGHGSPGGIVLRSDAGGERPVAAEPLRRFFAGRGVTLVVLNACFSRSQAESIAKEVPCVIGTTDAVDDEAARRFATAFYRALGDGLPIREAFKDGKDAVGLEGYDDVFQSFGDLDRSLVSGA